MAERTNNDVVAELAARAAGEAKLVSLGTVDGKSVQVLAVPGREGTRVESIKKQLDEYRDRPERRRGVARLEDLESFIALVGRFKDETSALFAISHNTEPQLLCVFNYNEPASVEVWDVTKPEGERISHRDGLARFGDHRATYAFPLSEEWTEWVGSDGEQMAQEPFATFIEERLLDVADPASAMAGSREFASKLGVSFASPQKLLELSRGLTVHIGQRVKQHVKLGSGEGQIAFAEEHSDEHGAPLSIPGAFIIQVPVFKNGAPYQIPARLRYRVQNGAVSWWFDLYRTDRVFDHAFSEACAKAKADTDLPLYRGQPEP